jgi:hypothetical protein
MQLFDTALSTAALFQLFAPEPLGALRKETERRLGLFEQLRVFG